MSSEIKWIKIVTDIFDDEKILLIESMPEADTIIVIWFKILCLAGKLNSCGVLVLNERIAYTDEMLAQVFRRPLGTVRLALTTFERFGMIEIINDTIAIPNWEKHQSVDRMLEMKEYNRIKQRESRARRKSLLSGDSDPDGVSTNVNDSQLTCQCSSYSLSNKSSSQSSLKNGENEVVEKEGDRLGRMFELFYDAYGKKVGRKNAEKAFARINPNEELFKRIMDGVERYHQSRNWREGYRKEPATWLNGECWNDDYSNEKSSGKSVSAQQYTQRDYTEEDLLAVSDDLFAEARSMKGK